MTETSSQSLGPEQVPKRTMELKPTNPSDESLWSSLGTKDSLGAALTKQGRYDEAEKLLRDVLETREKLGQSNEDPNMLRTMNNLAAALHHQGRFAEAEGLHRQVLESDEQNLGSEHTDTITSMHNLASLLAHQGKFEEAEELQRRALASSQKVSGPETLETLGIMGGLGDTLLRQQKYEQAETVSREVLAIRQRVLREDHPDIAASMHNMAAVLRHSGKVDEAEELQRREDAIRQTNRGKLASTSGLAGSPATRGYYDDVEQQLQDELKLSLETSGRNSQETRSNMNRLGDVLIRNGKFKEAEDMLRNALVAGTA